MRCLLWTRITSLRPGEDAQSFRAIAERSALPDSERWGSGDQQAGAYREWLQGQVAADGLSRAGCRRIAALKSFGVTWVVLGARQQRRFRCAYEDEAVKVCRLP